MHNSLTNYIKELEFDIKNSFSLLELSNNENYIDVINDYLSNLIQIVFEQKQPNFESKENIIEYAIQLAKKYLEEENLKKEIIFVLNISFLIYIEFDKKNNKLFLQEMNLYGSAFLLNLIKQIQTNPNKFKNLIFLLALKIFNKSVIDIYLKYEKEEEDLLNTLNNFLKFFENETIKINFKEKNKKIKKINLDELFYII